MTEQCSVAKIGGEPAIQSGAVRNQIVWSPSVAKVVVSGLQALPSAASENVNAFVLAFNSSAFDQPRPVSADFCWPYSLHLVDYRARLSISAFVSWLRFTVLPDIRSAIRCSATASNGRLAAHSLRSGQHE
jgi:hypothetical protein